MSKKYHKVQALINGLSQFIRWSLFFIFFLTHRMIRPMIVHAAFPSSMWDLWLMNCFSICIVADAADDRMCVCERERERAATNYAIFTIIGNNERRRRRWVKYFHYLASKNPKNMEKQLVAYKSFFNVGFHVIIVIFFDISPRLWLTVLFVIQAW